MPQHGADPRRLGVDMIIIIIILSLLRTLPRGGSLFSLPPGGGIILSRASGGEGCLACRAEFADHNARGFVLLFGDAWVFTAGDAWVAQRACGFLTVEGGTLATYDHGSQMRRVDASC